MQPYRYGEQKPTFANRPLHARSGLAPEHAADLAPKLAPELSAKLATELAAGLAVSCLRKQAGLARARQQQARLADISTKPGELARPAAARTTSSGHR